MAQKLKFGGGTWATKKGSTLAYNDENNNYKPLPFTTTRNSIATRVNKEGLIEVVGNDVPRIDYTDSSDGALLLENSATNLVTYSQDFSSGWSLDDATVSINSGISPDGTLNATLLKGNTNSSRHNLVTSAGANNTGTFSIFVKAKELKYVQIASANTTEQYVNFDLMNGVIGTVGSSFSNAKIEDYGNGWYRCIVVSANQFNGFYFSLVNGLNATWLESWVMPNSTDGLYIWGAMLEQNSFSTSYIPTSGSTVTRQADTANGSGNSEVFNDSEGVLMFEGRALVDDNTSKRISISDGSSNPNNLVCIDMSEYTNTIVGRIRTSNSEVAFLQSASQNQTQKNKIAVKYKVNDFALWINGFEVDTDNNGAVPIGLNDVSFDRGNGSNDFYGKTKELGYYDTALTDAELETLTSYRSLSELVTELNLNTL